MIPVFAAFFFRGDYVLATAVMLASGATDVIDGFIARRFNMITDLGKILDPIADKLTQMTLAVLMFIRFHGADPGKYPWMRAFAWVFLGFIAKEVLMFIFAGVVLLMGKRPVAAEIWGKLATVAFYVVMILLFLAGPGVGVLERYLPWAVLPAWAVQVMVVLTLVLMVVAFASYFPDTARQILNKEKKEEEPAE